MGAYSPIGSTASDSRGRIDTNYQLFGNVSLIEGRHAFKAGYEWRRTFINSFIDSGHRGKLVFSSLDDFPLRYRGWRQFGLRRRHALFLPERRRRVPAGFLAHESQDHRSTMACVGITTA